MIKSGSQVLGKQRSRFNLTRKEMLKKLNEQRDETAQFIEATKGASNEKSSTKKGTMRNSEITNNLTAIRDFATNM